MEKEKPELLNGPLKRDFILKNLLNRLRTRKWQYSIQKRVQWLWSLSDMLTLVNQLLLVSCLSSQEWLMRWRFKNSNRKLSLKEEVDGGLLIYLILMKKKEIKVLLSKLAEHILKPIKEDLLYWIVRVIKTIFRTW